MKKKNNELLSCELKLRIRVLEEKYKNFCLRSDVVQVSQDTRGMIMQAAVPVFYGTIILSGILVYIASVQPSLKDLYYVGGTAALYALLFLGIFYRIFEFIRNKAESEIDVIKDNARYLVEIDELIKDTLGELGLTQSDVHDGLTEYMFDLFEGPDRVQDDKTRKVHTYNTGLSGVLKFKQALAGSDLRRLD